MWADSDLHLSCPLSVPGQNVLAGIWVDHGSKLGDDNLVGLDVTLIGVALQKFASVSHLTYKQNTTYFNLDFRLKQLRTL